MQPQPTTPAQQTVEGMWWKEEKDVTGFVTLANVTSQPVQATVQVSDNQANGIAQHTVTISPHGMKLVNLTELPTLAGTEGGIRITYIGTPDALILNGGVQDEALGYSAGLAFASQPLQASQLPPHAKQVEFNSIAELGLMSGAADPMMNFPAGTTFTPFSVLRNTSNSPISLAPTIWWMQAGQAYSAQLQPVQLQPYQSQSLNVPSMLALAGIPNYNGSFNIVFNGNMTRGALLTAAGSVDQTKTYVFQVVPRAVAESASKSLQYWSTGNGDDTMIMLWNPADEAQDLVLKLFFTGGHYLLPIHLDPRATRMINLSEVVENAPPDSEGNTIPATVHDGSAKLTGSQADNQNMLIAMDAGVYNVRKATCGMVCYTCDGYSNWEVTPSSFTINAYTNMQMALVADYDAGQQYDLSSDGYWGSSNTNVATVDQTGYVTGVAGGSVTVGVSDSVDPDYAPNVCVYAGSPDPCPVGSGGGGSVAGNVYDPTPIINSISGQPWPAGTPNYPFTITGTGFGTSPGLTITGTGIDSYSIVGTPTDTQITAQVTVDASAPTESVTVAVTDQGINGQGFIGQSGQSNQGSNNAQVSAEPPPVVAINAGAPTAVPVAQAQPNNGPLVGNHEVFLIATCSPPQGSNYQVNPSFNWSISQGSDQAKIDTAQGDSSTMGIFGMKGGAQNGVTVSVTCKNINSGLTSNNTATAKMTAQQPGSLTIVVPDSTTENNCSVQNTPGCNTTRTFNYQVNDTNGAPMTFSGIDFWDSIQTQSQNSCNINTYAVTCSASVTSGQQTGNCDATANTGSNGQFSEHLNVCSAVCGSVQNGKCSGTCSTQATQTWVVNGFQLTKSLTYSCNSISVQ